MPHNPSQAGSGIRQPALFVLASLMVVVLLCGCGGGDNVDKLVKSEMSRGKIPAATVVVLQAGKIVKIGAYGLADMELAVPATSDTVFRLQSVSKQFTAAGVMMLVEEGKIGLDEPVSRYLDRCPESWRKMTVRHLLTQTSGLADFINEPIIDLKKDASEEDLLASIASRPLKFPPGDAWEYSNSNYLLAGILIHRVSGLWHGDFLAARIFKPLGMTRTSVPRTRESLSDRAKGYTLVNGRALPSAADTNLALSVLSYGGGGVQSTVVDMAKWDAALSTEQLLKKSTWAQVWAPVKLNNGNLHPYGLGWQLDDIAQHRRVWHAGNWTGFAAQIDRFVDDQLSVIVLTSLAGARTARISRAIAGTFIPALAVPVYKPIKDREPAVKERLLRGLAADEGRGAPPGGIYRPGVGLYFITCRPNET